MSAEVNNNDESTDEEVDENEDIPDSDTEKDPVVFESEDEEDQLSFESNSEDLDSDKDYSEDESEIISPVESNDESADENTDDETDEHPEKEKDGSRPKSTFKGNKPKTKKIETNASNINIKDISAASKITKHEKPVANGKDGPAESTAPKVTQKTRTENKRNLKSNKNVGKPERKGANDNIVSSTKAENANSDKSVTSQQVDEYEYDSSDEEDIRNTVGNVPMKWYDDYDHIGYDWDGQKLIKPQKGDQLDNFLKRMEDPDFWRTVKDPQTGQDVVLSEADIDLITRIQKQKVPDVTFDEYAVSIYFSPSPLGLRNAPIQRISEFERQKANEGPLILYN